MSDPIAEALLRETVAAYRAYQEHKASVTEEYALIRQQVYRLRAMGMTAAAISRELGVYPQHIEAMTPELVKHQPKKKPSRTRR